MTATTDRPDAGSQTRKNKQYQVNGRGITSRITKNAPTTNAEDPFGCRRRTKGGTS
jgi:hypothetical protein